jgi:hypothetical protein
MLRSRTERPGPSRPVRRQPRLRIREAALTGRSLVSSQPVRLVRAHWQTTARAARIVRACGMGAFAQPADEDCVLRGCAQGGGCGAASGGAIRRRRTGRLGPCLPRPPSRRRGLHCRRWLPRSGHAPRPCACPFAAPLPWLQSTHSHPIQSHRAPTLDSRPVPPHPARRCYSRPSPG